MNMTATVPKLVTAIALIAIWLTASAYAASEKRQSLRQAKPKNIDLRPVMKRMKLKEGSNIVHSGRDVKLIAEVKDGKVVEWRATSTTGSAIPIEVMSTQVSGKKPKKPRPCILCPHTPSTGPLDEVCYELPCDKLPKPTVSKP